jgi:hypothetical protein
MSAQISALASVLEELGLWPALNLAAEQLLTRPAGGLQSASLELVTGGAGGGRGPGRVRDLAALSPQEAAALMRSADLGEADTALGQARMAGCGLH